MLTDVNICRLRSGGALSVLYWYNWGPRPYHPSSTVFRRLIMICGRLFLFRLCSLVKMEGRFKRYLLDLQDGWSFRLLFHLKMEGRYLLFGLSLVCWRNDRDLLWQVHPACYLLRDNYILPWQSLCVILDTNFGCWPAITVWPIIGMVPITFPPFRTTITSYGPDQLPWK